MKRDVEELVQTPENSDRIVCASFLAFVSVFYSALVGAYDCTAVTAAVLVSSVNYWRRPTRGFRRNIDIAAVAVALGYQTFRSFDSSYQFAYLLAVTAAGACYLAARLSDDKGVASMWHCGIHVIGNVGNVALYYGFTV
jgi:hypothetical protein